MGFEKLEKLRKTYVKAKKLRFLPIIIILLLVFLIIIIFLEVPILVFICIICLCVCEIFIATVKSSESDIIEYYEEVNKHKKKLMVDALKNMLQDSVFYDNYPDVADYVNGRIIKYGGAKYFGDYVKGKYKNVDVELSEFIIAYGKEDSNESDSSIVYFDGICFAVDFHKAFKSDLLLYSKKYYYMCVVGEKLETNDREFNKIFNIRSNNKLEALDILTSVVIEKLKKIYSEAKSNLIIFFENNKLYICLDECRGLFWPNEKEEITADKYKKKILDDFGIVFDFIETLDLDNDLFKK